MNAVETAKHLLLQSGTAWILWLLAALSAVSLAIIVERWLYLRARDGDLERLARELAGPLEQHDWPAAIARLDREGVTATAIASAGLRLAAKGPGAVEKAMDSGFALERRKLERGLAFLGTLGNNAPFVGLFGTVVGVIHAFEELGHSAPGHAAAAAGAGAAGAAGQVASQLVMGAIAEALVATAVGILVALPAVAAYNFFQRRVTMILSGSEVLSNLVLAYLSAAPSDGSSDGSREGRGVRRVA
jgi:biopolymer transport protein ExbB